FFSQFTVMVLSNMLLLAGVLAVLWLEDWRMGVALSVFTLAAQFVLNRTRRFATPYQIGNRQAHAMMYGFLEERLAGIEDIRANADDPYALRCFAQLSRQEYDKATQAEWS